jgi:hypothetical protein
MSQNLCIHHTSHRVFLVPKLEIRNERSNFESDETLQENSQTKLCAFPQKALQQCSQEQKELWEQRIRNSGNYFERNKAK